MDYEWDPDKAVANLRKHGVDFADAALALEDALEADGFESFHPVALAAPNDATTRNYEKELRLFESEARCRCSSAKGQDPYHHSSGRGPGGVV